jgi:hypothetical protein
MAITTESYNSDGTTRTYNVSSTILSQSHCRVDFYYDDGSGSATDHEISPTYWDVINNSIVFSEAPIEGYVVKITVSTDGEGLESSPSIMSTVAASIDNVNTVAVGINNVNTVADNITDVNTVTTNIADINIVAGDKTNIDIVANTISSSDADTAGQLLGASTIKSIQYMNKTLGSKEITIQSGLNSFIIDSLILPAGAAIIIEDNSLLKIL